MPANRPAVLLSLLICGVGTSAGSAQTTTARALPQRVHLATQASSQGVGFTLYDSPNLASAARESLTPTPPPVNSSPAGQLSTVGPIVQEVPEDVIFQFQATSPPPQPPENRALELLARPRETYDILPTAKRGADSPVQQASYAAAAPVRSAPAPQDDAAAAQLDATNDEPVLHPADQVDLQEPQETPADVVRSLSQEIRHGKLSEIRFDARQRSGPETPMAERYPERLSVPDVAAPSRQVTARTYAWQATNLRYRRPYFEQVMLERHGLSLPPGRQWLASTTRFYTTAMFLPVIMLCRPPGQLYDHRAFAHSGSPLSDDYLYAQPVAYEPLDPQEVLTEPPPAEPILSDPGEPDVTAEPLEVIESLEAIEPPVMRETLPPPAPRPFDAEQDWND